MRSKCNFIGGESLPPGKKGAYGHLGPALQLSAFRRHSYLREAVQHNVHHPTHAATLARPLVGARVYRHSRKLRRRAGQERHVVY